MWLHWLFFLSGISGLVLQVVWVRQFGNVFGNTIHSASLVMAVFMLGLGAGGAAAGVWADRQRDDPSKRMLEAYGRAELLIGLGGAALALSWPLLEGLSAGMSRYSIDARGWHELSVPSYLWRYALAALLLTPITCLMGATLTFLIRHVVGTDLSAAGWRIGALYGANTAGAALGALLSDFAMVPALGLRGTQLAAAALNGIAGAGALLLVRGSRARTEPMISRTGTAPATQDTGPGAVQLACVCLFLTGFTAMGMEIVWFRFLSATLGSYRAVFSLLLAVILAGLWVGAVLGGAAERCLKRPALLLMGAQGLFAFGTLRMLATFDPGAVSAHLSAIPPGPDGETVALLPEVWALLRGILSVVGWPALMMGCAYPLGNAIVQRTEERVGRRAGALYLANTVGAVAGSLSAGFVFLRLLGVQGTTLLLVCLTAPSLLALFLLAGEVSEERTPRVVALLSSGALVVAGVVSWTHLPPRLLLGITMAAVPANERVLVVREGLNETLAITETSLGERLLYTNGHPMSATAIGARRYMQAFAHVPLLQAEDPRRALLICFGVGNTLHALTLHSALREIHVAELSREILEHAEYFRATNQGALEDSRVSVFVNDGRQHLRMMPESSYDLVTLEPPPITFAGVSALYSMEFYELVRSRLTPHGFATQWLPIYQVPSQAARGLVRAFIDVFPDAVLLSGNRAELILMGTKSGALPPLSPRHLQERLDADAPLRRDLLGIDLGHLTELAGMFVADPEVLRQFAASVPALSDDRPLLEYARRSPLLFVRLPGSLFQPRRLGAWCPSCLADDRHLLPDLPDYVELLERLYSDPDFLSIGAGGPIGRHAVWGQDDVDGALGTALSRSGYLSVMNGTPFTGAADPIDPYPPAAVADLVARAADPDAPNAVRLHAAAACLSVGRTGEAILQLRKVLDAVPQHVAARFGLGYCLFRSNRLGQAIAEYERGLEQAPANLSARLLLAHLYRLHGCRECEHAALRRILEADPRHARALATMCRHLHEAGHPAEAAPYCLESGTNTGLEPTPDPPRR